MSNKKELSERDICTQFILPALVKAGWNVEKQIREEVSFTNGRIFVKGKKSVRGERKRTDAVPLIFYRVKRRGDDLVQIELNEAAE